MGQLKLPQTSTRQVVTKMILRDRETGIIAGLRQQSTGETVTSIPFLGDIPIIGWLFRHRSRPPETNMSTNLLILITPTVIDIERRQKTEFSDLEREVMDALGKEFFLGEETAPVISPPVAPKAP
jgi:type II secretory pathway component GspD/PulD (secretin)